MLSMLSFHPDLNLKVGRRGALDGAAACLFTTQSHQHSHYKGPLLPHRAAHNAFTPLAVDDLLPVILQVITSRTY